MVKKSFTKRDMPSLRMSLIISAMTEGNCAISGRKAA